MSAFDPVMDYFHAKPAAPQAQPPLVRVPVEVIVQPSGASSIAYLTRLPIEGETVPLGARVAAEMCAKIAENYASADPEPVRCRPGSAGR